MIKEVKPKSMSSFYIPTKEELGVNNISDLKEVTSIKIKKDEKYIFIKYKIFPLIISDINLDGSLKSFNIISLPKIYIINELKLITDLNNKLKSIFVFNVWHPNCSDERKSIPDYNLITKPPNKQKYCMPPNYYGIEINIENLKKIKINLSIYYYKDCFWRDYNNIEVDIMDDFKEWRD